MPTYKPFPDSWGSWHIGIDPGYEKTEPVSVPAPHDFSNPYLVDVGEYVGARGRTRDVSRRCVACGVAGISPAAYQPCVPRPHWRAEYERKLATHMAWLAVQASSGQTPSTREPIASQGHQSHCLRAGTGIWSLREVKS